MMYRPNRVKLNDGWVFRFEDGASEQVTLPHTWNTLDTMSTDPDWHYRRGVGVYEKQFQPPADAQNQRLWLEFEAVAQTAKVFFDDELLTEHYGGYTSFRVNIPNRAGTIRVEADNTPNPDVIPSDRSDFFLYGGITRNVWLYRTYDAWIESVKAEMICGEASGEVKLTIHLAGDLSKVSSVVSHIYDPEGFPEQVHVHPIDDNTISQSLVVDKQYHLWSPTEPNLYFISIRLQAEDILFDNPINYTKPIDQVGLDIGFRTYDFPEYGAFYLNGERLLLRGTHRHEDWAGYGCAVPDDITRREFQMIKDAGFNFVRTGHYPQSRAALEACDELGIIVWEELPWCRGGIGGDKFKHHAKTMLQEMITQHYNHPSIIFWGLGNELDWESDHPDSTDDKVRDFLRELHDFAHTLDSSRLTALRRFDYGADVVDVYSPSIWAGWYRGKYTDYELNIRDALAKYPRLLHAEWGGDSHAGR
ncbi:MAG: glycoside hydrolase family 2 TIM barrel-domain containing protein, partial [Chloroflexota bacterium]